MIDIMIFPDTVEEFMEQYKITDTEQVYTNGTELVPIFRMKQWFEHCLTKKRKHTGFALTRNTSVNADGQTMFMASENQIGGDGQFLTFRIIQRFPHGCRYRNRRR